MKPTILGLALSVFLSQTAHAKEMTLTGSMVREVTAVIQKFGYMCPIVKLAFAEGPSPRGTVVKVYCGPLNREGVYPKLIYRITFTPNDLILVRPWE